MEIYTTGFTQKTAAQFFETLKKTGIRQLYYFTVLILL
jgi:hypothetical protein